MLRSYRDLAALVLALLLFACSAQGSSGTASANSPAPALAMMPAAVASAGAPAPQAPAMPASPSGAPVAPVAGPASPDGAATAGSAPSAAGSSEPGASASDPAPNAPPQACAAMVAAAKDFIASLDSDSLKSGALLPFDRRRNYAYEPQVADRPGVSLMMMSDAQQQKALALVHAGLSEEGFKQAETVRALENLKNITMYEANMRDPRFYFLAIFGEPSETGAWAWQWEGHHLALHYTLSACAVADAPTFIGSWPADVMNMVTGGPPVGTRNLEQEEDLGRALAMALDADPAKQMQAIVTSAYRETFPEGPDKAEPLMPAGLLASAMSESEQMQLRQIVALYAGMMPMELAAARLKRIEDHGGFENVSFVWSGALVPKQRHYYRIEGQSFMIEYRNNDGDHIHSVWRDFSDEFGDDLPQAKSP